MVQYHIFSAAHARDTLLQTGNSPDSSNPHTPYSSNTVCCRAGLLFRGRARCADDCVGAENRFRAADRGEGEPDPPPTPPPLSSTTLLNRRLRGDSEELVDDGSRRDDDGESRTAGAVGCVGVSTTGRYGCMAVESSLSTVTKDACRRGDVGASTGGSSIPSIRSRQDCDCDCDCSCDNGGAWERSRAVGVDAVDGLE